MNKSENVDPQAHIDAFREQARALGFNDAEELPVELESADDFIARMKAREEPAPALTVLRRSRRRTITTALVAAAAAAVAIAVVFRPASSPVVADTPPLLDYEFAAAVRVAYAPGEPAEPALSLLSQAAEEATAPSGTGPVQHHVSDNWFSDQDDSGNSVITPRVTQTWLEPDGSLLTTDTVGRQLTSDGRGIPTDAPTYSTSPSTDQLPAGTVDAAFVERLSTEPDALKSQLLSRADCPDSARPSAQRSLCLYDELRVLFSTYVVPPDVAGAAWEALRGEVGFTTLGSVEDRAGRNGVAISLVSDVRPEYRFILIGSPETGQLLGTEEILIKPDPNLDVEAPSVISFTAITTATRVEKAPTSP
ncbi:MULTISPECIES: CU044_5270 family protein [unclassified Aeromicrobium]|uniref:CU044_5270 family protein n=1 Tax=unclassified Aeromicrobium TaxID=2633570 RepID=UPI00288B9103|nr:MULTISPECIES: CU044_5270 family protein [unclassified Aeromicrobium]